MQYMGSKASLAKYIIPILSKNRRGGLQYYVEPFVGGANIIDRMTGPRIGADANPYIIALYQALQKGWRPKPRYTKDEYFDINANRDRNPAETGYVLTACSFRCKWAGSWGGTFFRKGEGLAHAQDSAYQSLIRQIPFLMGIEFIHSDYASLAIPPESLIYCDPPYADTTSYKQEFDSARFWQWCRDKSDEGHTIFVSEYQAPDDFDCILEIPHTSHIGYGENNGRRVYERLFVYSKGNYLYLPSTNTAKTFDLFGL